jgi:hypothetical protein
VVIGRVVLRRVAPAGAVARETVGDGMNRFCTVQGQPGPITDIFLRQGQGFVLAEAADARK